MSGAVFFENDGLLQESISRVYVIMRTSYLKLFLSLVAWTILLQTQRLTKLRNNGNVFDWVFFLSIPSEKEGSREITRECFYLLCIQENAKQKDFVFWYVFHTKNVFFSMKHYFVSIFYYLFIAASVSYQ